MVLITKYFNFKVFLMNRLPLLNGLRSLRFSDLFSGFFLLHFVQVLQVFHSDNDLKKHTELTRDDEFICYWCLSFFGKWDFISSFIKLYWKHWRQSQNLLWISYFSVPQNIFIASYHAVHITPKGDSCVCQTFAGRYIRSKNIIFRTTRHCNRIDWIKSSLVWPYIIARNKIKANLNKQER